ncbi:MAG: 4Fe-4S binding protein [Ignavibacteriales bacterium]|nr:4Fe-4S binding protein [Ignavibacteriales bacterium]MCB9207777.1 4Fe-4S binding protein [Ignavibacteriales bacterium]
MDLQFLKKIRVIISLIFFISVSVLYFDLSFSIQSWFADYPLFLQFIPSFLKLISVGFLAGLGFFIVLILTILFGRVYCSTICPLGIFQDIILFIRRKIKRINFDLTSPWNKTRYTILTITILLFLLGISLGLNLLDPYSNYGRIVNNIFRPTAIGVNNLSASILESLGIYFISPMEFVGVKLFSFIFSLSILILVAWMSVKNGRLFCNSICPVGTFLGLISKFSIFKIGIIESNCIKCGDCETVCKSSCINSADEQIDFSRCVGCFNCFDVCPSIGISYLPRYKKEKAVVPNNSKRDFFKNIGIFLIGSNLIAKAQQKIEVYKLNTVPVIRNTPVSPPGSLSIENFNDNCTACHLCVASCPTQVLQPSFLEYGLLQIMQPRMDYKSGYCTFECKICSEVCPSGAIVNQDLEAKKTIQLGKVNFIKENCVVYTQKTDCGACAEHCPTKAVKMELDIEVNKNAPVTNQEICVGCGACEFACPTKPYKAIYVDGNPVHLTAQKPKEEKLEEKVDLKEAFPF